MSRIVLLPLLILSASALAGPGIWTSNGPDGGPATIVEVSAANPNRLYLSNNNLLFRSDDAGGTFQRIGSNVEFGFVGQVAVATSNADVLFVAGSSLYRSSDGGTTWTALSLRSIASIALPANSISTIYVSTNDQGLFKSVNSGGSFSKIGIGVLPDLMGAVAVDPTNSLRIAASTCTDNPSLPIPKMFLSTDAGATFTPVSVSNAVAPPTIYCGRSLVFSPNTPGLVLSHGTISSSTLGNFSAVLRSTDSGANYSDANGPRGRGFSFPAAGQVFAANFSGAALTSSDSGANFAVLASSPVLPGLSAVENNDTAIKTDNSAVRFLATGDGLYASSDSGLTWVKRTVGVRATKIRALALSPQPTVNTFYAGHGEGSTVGQGLPVYRSLDSGQNWSNLSNTGQIETVRSLLLDENTALTANPVLYMGGRDLFPQSGRPFFQRASSMAKSVDGGLTFSPLNNFAGLAAPPTNSISHVNFLGTRVVVPDRSVIAGGVWSKLYSGGEGFIDCDTIGGTPTSYVPRFWRTLNAGANWDTVSTPGGAVGSPGSDGLPLGECIGDGSLPTPFPVSDAPYPLTIVVDPVSPNTLYVGTVLSFYGIRTNYVPNAFNGVFRSTDGGVTWQHRSSGLPRYSGSTNSAFAVLSLVMDPSNRNILYAATNPFNGTAGNGSVYKTLDGGATWTPSGSGLAGQEIRSLLIDPTNSLRIYATAGGITLNPGAVFVSENGGASWNSISAGLPADSANTLALKGDTLYAGTNSGVYEFTRVQDGDGDGASNSTENGATVSGDINNDGVQDAAQSNVAADGLEDDLARRGRTGYGVIVNPENLLAGTSQLGADCQQIYDVISISDTSFGLDPEFPSKPFGSFRFEVADCSQARITLRFPDSLLARNTVIRSYGPAIQGDVSSVGWNTLPATLSADRRSIQFVIGDNQLGDARADTRRILFQGGPALDLFENGFEN